MKDWPGEGVSPGQPVKRIEEPAILIPIAGYFKQYPVFQAFTLICYRCNGCNKNFATFSKNRNYIPYPLIHSNAAIRRTRKGVRRGKMDRDAFISACKGLGLRVSKSGTITDILRTYGTVENGTEFVTDDNNQRPYDFLMCDVESMRFLQAEKRIELTLIDGSVTYMNGDFERDADGAIIVNNARMPSCQSELDDIMDLLFPGISEKLYWDVLAEQGMIDPSLFGLESEFGQPVGDEPNFMPLTDEVFPFYYDMMERRLRELGFEGRFPGREVRDLVLKKRMMENKRNLFLEWIESVEYKDAQGVTHKGWDGKPRLRTWFMDGLGATCNGALMPDEEERYLGDATEAWFLSGIQRMFKEAPAEIVPVLIGGEGIGKGQFLKYTAGYNEDWFISTSAQLEGPGQEEKFLEGVRGCVIVELSESTQFSTVKGAELLKTFVSKTRDKRRKAYAREVTISIRRFMLVATSNKNNVFLDVGGGNRRYFPMYCDPNKATTLYDPKYKNVGRYEVEQVWAEALFKYRNDPNANTYLSKEAAELAAIMQDYGTVENTNVNMIDEWLDDVNNGYSEVGSRITRDEIFFNVLNVSVGGAGTIPTSAEFAFKQWADIQKCWRKLAKPLRLNGKVTRHIYERVYTADDIMQKRRSNMVNIVPGHEDSFIDVVGIIRRRAKIYHFSQFDDPFPVEGLTEREIDALLDSGYIYSPDLNATPEKRQFFLMTMP